jgi:hypothetical protein
MNPDKINWKYLSFNPAAIYLLEKNQYKIDWRLISANPNIFELDKDQYKKALNYWYNLLN